MHFQPKTAVTLRIQQDVASEAIYILIEENHTQPQLQYNIALAIFKLYFS